MSRSEKVTYAWDPLPDEAKRPQPAVGRPMGVYVPVTYPAWGQRITSCFQCIGWTAYVDVQDGQVVVVEWHQEGCEASVGLCHAGMPAGAHCGYCGAVNVETPKEPCHGELAPGMHCADCGVYNADEPSEGEPQ